MRPNPLAIPASPARKKQPRSRVLVALLLIGAVLGCSCAYTTSTALLPAHLHTVAIPVFENVTTEYSLEQEITEAVIRRFVEDNHLKVVDERVADSVIRGRIIFYRNAVFGISSSDLANEYRVAITVDVTFKDNVKNREVWHDAAMEKTANYYVQSVPGQVAMTELDGRREAIKKLADEILTRSVENW